MGELDKTTLGALTESQKETLHQLAAKATDPIILGGFAMLSGIIVLFMSWALGSAALYFGLILGGPKVRYASVFSVFIWSWLPFLLNDLVRAAWLFFTGHMITNQGLSYLVATGDRIVDSGNPLWILASMADVYFIWHFGLIYFLIRAFRSRDAGLVLTLITAKNTLFRWNQPSTLYLWRIHWKTCGSHTPTEVTFSALGWGDGSQLPISPGHHSQAPN